MTIRRTGAAIIILMLIACGAPDDNGTARENARCATIGATAKDNITGAHLMCMRTRGLTPRWERI